MINLKYTENASKMYYFVTGMPNLETLIRKMYLEYKT